MVAIAPLPERVPHLRQLAAVLVVPKTLTETGWLAALAVVLAQPQIGVREHPAKAITAEV
jgi:hypothetical protein